MQHGPLVRRGRVTSVLRVDHSHITTRVVSLVHGNLVGNGKCVLARRSCYIIINTVGVSVHKVTSVHCPRTTSRPNSIRYSTNNIKHGVTRGLTLLNQSIRLVSTVNGSFCNRALLRRAHHTNIGISGYVHLRKRDATACLTVTGGRRRAVLTVGSARVLRRLAPRLLGASQSLVHRTNIILTSYGLAPRTLR